MWNNVVELFRDYMGTGLVVAWFFVCVGYLFFQEKDKSKRILFVYVPLILLLLFFNPLFIKVLYGFIGTEIYYRILWLMPMSIVIAYTIVKLCMTLVGKKRYGVLLGATAMIILSGSCIYQSPFFSRAENPEHVPVAVAQICDRIQVEGREIMAAFPGELISYVRQYSPLICMPYGRGELVSSWSVDTDFFNAMEEEVLDVEELASYGEQYQCHYIIVASDKELEGQFEDYEYLMLEEIEGYRIYQNKNMYFGY